MTCMAPPPIHTPARRATHLNGFQNGMKSDADSVRSTPPPSSSRCETRETRAPLHPTADRTYFSIRCPVGASELLLTRLQTLQERPHVRCRRELEKLQGIRQLVHNAHWLDHVRRQLAI